MSSLKMTFSLASLVLILGLVFATAPVMAAAVSTNGITEGTLDPTDTRFGILSRGATANPTGTAVGTVRVLIDTGGDNDDLPNLEEQFVIGTTIALLAPANEGRNGSSISATADALNGPVLAKDVVISEIMWGLNDNVADFATRVNEQFIEFYNTTGASVNMAGWFLYIVDNPLDILDPAPAEKDVAIPDADPAANMKVKDVVSLNVTADGTANAVQYVVVDMVSNDAGGRWTNDIGQSGTLPRDNTTVTPVDLISMYRNIHYANVLKADHVKDKPVENRKKQLDAVLNGTAKGSWKASTRDYDSNRKGSPGKAHFAGALSALSPSTVNLAKVIINEIGNSSDDKYDWLELRNTSGADIVIEKYHLSNVVGDKKDDVSLVKFPKITIPKDGVLLVVNTDPKEDNDHPIAGGVNVIDEEGDNEDDILKVGITSRYYVNAGLKIPDDKVLLILRTRNDRTGTHAEGLAALVDVTGTASVADPANTLATGLWPLVKTGAANGKAIKGGATKFANGTVHRRNKADKTTNAEEIWVVSEDAGGIGYKRVLAGNGTPGYVNGAAKEFNLKTDHDDYKAPPVTISEIMYDSGDGRLPQWIELYNSSMTDSIKVEGWQLKLENADDVPIRGPAVTVKFKAKFILPNQTILIAASSARQASDQGGEDNFPDSRIIDLWRDGLTDKDDLEIRDGTTRSKFRFLSETAFKVTLMDKAGVEVDTAGNMGADGTAAWDLPTAEEDRSSIIRRYDKGVARDGTMPVWSGDGSLKGVGGEVGDAGWILASASSLDLGSDTYYGSRDDMGTPGFRAGGPLPVSLSKFRPERLDSGAVVIRWITESELNNAGFNILRSETRDGVFTKLNTNLIAGQGTISERTVYEYADISAKPNVVYYYQIQDVSLDGQVQTLRTTHLRGNVTAAGKLTTIWAELKTLHE